MTRFEQSAQTAQPLQFRSLIQNEPHWLKLTQLIARGTVPAAVGIEVSEAWQSDVASMFAHLVLCEHGCVCGECASCKGWVDGEHPDWISGGSPGEAPLIDECRKVSGELSLSPVLAPLRLLTLYAPEKMNPGAANSLLKITEEPPSRGRMLYMMNKGADILPTLRSRLWIVQLNIEQSITPVAPPGSDRQWIQWLADHEKTESSEWYALAYGYSAWLQQNGMFERAAALIQLAETAVDTHLSSAMWTDALFLLLRGEYPYERVFDDWRTAPLDIV